MSKKFFLLILTGIVSGIIIACGPSEEKVTQAQQKYRELIETHNQVVAAHEEIADASLDEELVALKGLVDELKAHNLNEMEDEEIDVVINSMDSLVVSYQEYLQKIADIKVAEEAAVLVDIPVTLFNDASISFTSVNLYEKGDSSKENVLINEALFAPGETMEGLMIQRDVDDTPWILELMDEEGTKYTIEIPTADLEQTGKTFKISYNAETEKVEIL